MGLDEIWDELVFERYMAGVERLYHPEGTQVTSAEEGPSGATINTSGVS